MNATPQSRAGDDGAGPQGQPAIGLGPWHVVIGGLVLATIVIVTIYVVQHYATATDAGAILGIVIPALATIGAAVFGITVAYNAGTARGAAHGQAVAATARTAAKAEVAKVLKPTVEAANEALRSVVTPLETMGQSTIGDETVTVPVEGAEPLVIEKDAIDQARTSLAQLEGAVNGMLPPE